MEDMDDESRTKKIMNPLTGRSVLSTGRIGRSVLKTVSSKNVPKTKQPMEFEVLPKGTVIYHERTHPFTDVTTPFSAFPYMWFQTECGFITGSVCSSRRTEYPTYNAFKYVYETTVDLRLMVTKDDKTLRVVEKYIQDRINEFPLAYKEEENDYPVTSGICQILGFGGYFDSTQFHKKEPAFVVLCSSLLDSKHLKLIHNVAVGYTDAEVSKLTSERDPSTGHIYANGANSYTDISKYNDWTNLSRERMIKYRSIVESYEEPV